jgi:hypothetical protein
MSGVRRDPIAERHGQTSRDVGDAGPRETKETTS